MPRNSKNRYLINSILRASSVLRCLSGGKSHFKISEIARELELNRSAVYRILLSLEKDRFVEKDENTGEYSLGIATFEIGSTYLGQTDLIKVSTTVMADLALKTQETVGLAVLSDTVVTYMYKVEPPRTLKVMSKTSRISPVYCTALGKVLLAHQPKDEFSRIISELKLKPFTQNTITSKKRLAEELRVIRKKGYAFDRREHEEDSECIGAPIRDHFGDVIAALSTSGPKKKIGTPQEKKYVSWVMEAAAMISSKMGYRGEARSLH
jgi:DNA-binding IclR family transcriptional regulator